jgi:hypothetical protein
VSDEERQRIREWLLAFHTLTPRQIESLENGIVATVDAAARRWPSEDDAEAVEEMRRAIRGDSGWGEELARAVLVRLNGREP